MSKVLIVDDHPVIRMAMRVLLEKDGHTVIGETDNGVDALSVARELLPELVVLDIGIPKLDGLEVISRLTALGLSMKILVLTGQNASLFAMRCMQAGAAGFVCKQGGLGELVNAVNAVAAGYSYFPSIAVRPSRKNMGAVDDAELIRRLSDREMSVLQYLANGFTNKDIAEQMFISNKTVSTYKTRLLLKLNAHTLVDLIDFAKRNALV